MILKYFFVYVPATVFGLLLLSILMASAFPLSWFGRIYNYQPQGETELALILMSVFIYLALSYLLLRLGVTTLWIRGVTALVGSVGISVVVAMNMLGAAISGRGNSESITLELAWWMTTPVRNEHYLWRLESDNTEYRQRAADGLKRSIDSSGVKREKVRVLRAVAKALNKEQDADVRHAMLRLLKTSSLQDAPLQAEVVAGLKANDPAIRDAAAKVLGKVNAPPDTIITALLVVAGNDSDITVRHQALQSLSQLAPRHKELEKLLIISMEHGDPFAATTLLDINQSDLRVLLAFKRFLRSTDPSLRVAWLTAVVDTPPDGSFREASIREPLIKSQAFNLRLALLDALRDHDARVRVAAITAIERAYPHDAQVAQVFAGLLQDDAVSVRQVAVIGILRYIYDLMDESSDQPKPKKPRVVDMRIQQALIERLQDIDVEIREKVAICLSTAAPTEPDIQLAMIKAIDNKGRNSGDYYQNLINGIITGSKVATYQPNSAVLVAARNLLHHQDDDVRLGGMMITQWNRPRDSAGESALIQEMRNASEMEMWENALIENSIVVLARITPHSAAAVAELTKLIGDSGGSMFSYEASEAAKQILKSIKKP